MFPFLSIVRSFQDRFYLMAFFNKFMFLEENIHRINIMKNKSGRLYDNVIHRTDRFETVIIIINVVTNRRERLNG